MKLRNYQKILNAAVLAFLESNSVRGQVYAPTGSGKTVCFIKIIEHAIANGAKNIAVIHPRIALSQDQLRRFQSAFGTGVHFTSFHSGGHIAGQNTIKEIHTCDAEELKTVLEQTTRPHITFSSYKSFGKIADIEFDMVIADEAHNFVEPQFYEYLPNIKAKKILFYTATPVTDEMYETEYMMDYSLFGKVIASVEPRELIAGAYIVAPLIHTLELTTNEKANMADPVSMIARAFIEQYKEITSHGMKFAQMLVAARGLSDLRKVEEELVTLWKILDTESDGLLGKVDVYTIDGGAAYHNGKLLKDRDTALQRIKKSGKNAIVIHYDTLAEGIDIDSLTGALIMRRLSKSKFLQTIGRCGRPFAEDIGSDGEPRKDRFDPENHIDTRVKPRCIVTIPVVDGSFIGNFEGVEYSEAFIAAGYDDLWTYTHQPDDDPTGWGGGKKGDEPPLLSSILDHSIQREIVDIQALFDKMAAGIQYEISCICKSLH